MKTTLLKSLLTAFLMLFSFTATSAYDFKVDGIYYNKIGDNEVEVTYEFKLDTWYVPQSDYAGNIVIPSQLTYDGTMYSVTSIGEYAFYGCSSLTSVTIPNSVTSIGASAFSGCSGLTSVTIPNSVTSIGNWAFSGCSGLTSVTIPNSVTSIGEWAFYNCSGLTSFTIPNSVTSIGDNAFSGCSGLTSVTIPNSVTSIGWASFYACSGLTSVTIPNSVTSIGWYAFSGCSGLTSVTIPNSVTSIGAYAFRECKNITKLSIEAGNEKYFTDGHSILAKLEGNKVELNSFVVLDTSYTIPNSVTSIGDGAFRYCDGLTSVTIPNSVTSIGEWAFEDCSGLTSVTIPNSVTSIGMYAFRGCSGLTSVTIGNSVTSIGEGAFSGCSGLTSLNIPSSVDSIGVFAFSNCKNITKLSIEVGNAKYFTDGHSILKKLEGNKVDLNSFVVWDSSYIIPNSVTSIGYGAFGGCSGLTSVTIPNSVTSIGERAFSGCTNLKDLSLGAGLRNIGDFAFANCAAIRKITCYATQPPSAGPFSFFVDGQPPQNEVYENADLYVPQESLNDYKNASVWKEFYNIHGAEITGINGVTIDSAANGNQKVYDLQGRKLQKTEHGLNIINGKKVMVK